MEEVLIKELESGKSYIIYYTHQSGLDRRTLMQFGEKLKDCTVFLQPVLDINEIKIVDKCD